MYFLFIEIKNIEIIELLGGLRQILSEKQINTTLHITIKGPQQNPFKEELLNEYMDEYYPLVLSGVGVFEYAGTFFVHLKAHIHEMDKYQLWYKPTFKGEKNPHITICETKDREYANKVCQFLSNEVGDLICHEYKFSEHIQTKQTDMFKMQKIKYSESDKHISHLINIDKIKLGIFDRATALAELYKFKKSQLT